MADSQHIDKKRDSRRKRASRSRKSSHVPAQALGYLIQPIRLLQMLLDAPADSSVTLEVFEDVGMETSTGQKLASQVKTGLVKNPLTDKSPEFWKTLANWCDAIDSRELDPEQTTFEIYVARHRKGKIATLFHEAKSTDEAKNAVNAARKSISGKPSGKRIKHSPTVAETYADSVLGHPALTALIRRFQITTATVDPLADLRPTVAARWIRPESVDMVIHHAHGWLKEKIDALLLARKPACIATNEFNNEMLSFLPRCDFKTMVASMAGLPSAEEVAAEKVRTYVRQLEIISLDEESTLHAINEYLRASVTRTKLAEQCIVNDDSFTEYEEALTSFWRNKRRHNTLVYTQHTPQVLGQLLLSDCCLRQQTLQGLEMPAYFTPGSYHVLADDESIGWHPDYQATLRSSAA
jgi:hypothetical protein